MVKVDLVNRTVTNTGDVGLTLMEFIVKKTIIDPGDTVPLDPATVAIEI